MLLAGLYIYEKLLALWKEFLNDVGCTAFVEDPLFMELTNESIMEFLVEKTYAMGRHGHMHIPPTNTLCSPL